MSRMEQRVAVLIVTRAQVKEMIRVVTGSDDIEDVIDFGVDHLGRLEVYYTNGWMNAVKIGDPVPMKLLEIHNG